MAGSSNLKEETRISISGNRNWKEIRIIKKGKQMRKRGQEDEKMSGGKGGGGAKEEPRPFLGAHGKKEEEEKEEEGEKTRNWIVLMRKKGR